MIADDRDILLAERLAAEQNDEWWLGFIVGAMCAVIFIACISLTVAFSGF